ncbi:hypothetical protein EVA_06232 [gut metagenome]|uniref:Uncharacterized protein n=1 Tax=gut metagenome TaxID=749906 RepID=J9GSN4_9ZZZZ
MYRYGECWDTAPANKSGIFQTPTHPHSSSPGKTLSYSAPSDADFPQRVHYQSVPR